MIKVLFVCHGNICRSVMAEYMFLNLINEKGIKDDFLVDSCAVSREEIGNPIYHLARRKLESMGVPIYNHYARQITKSDLETFDYIFLMDESNMNILKRLFPNSNLSKVRLLLKDRSISDPWYSGNFDETYDDIMIGINNFLVEIGVR